MNRYALVVGINRYPFLPWNGNTSHLTTPAKDAEAIAFARLRGLYYMHHQMRLSTTSERTRCALPQD